MTLEQRRLEEELMAVVHRGVVADSAMTWPTRQLLCYLEMVWGFFLVSNAVGIYWDKLSTHCILLWAHRTLGQCSPTYNVDVHC